MPACKVCGSWFVKIKPHEELCDKCECALYRLSGYVARVTRCKDCKHYLIANEFEGGKRYMCEVNHFSYINSDGDMRYCSYGERKDDADG